jgi:hypothetical protein
MVEVDSECSRELDVMRVELDEVKANNLSLSERINQLLNDNILLTAENKILKEKNNLLSSQIAVLNQNNQELATKIQDLKTQVEIQTTISNPPVVIPQEQSKKSEKNLSNYLWPLVSTPLGAVAGTLRGATFKGLEYSDSASSKAANNIPSVFVTKVGGLIVGNVLGAVTGLVRGVIDGVRYGFSEPYSTKSVSLEGRFASDWDPYSINSSQKPVIEQN